MDSIEFSKIRHLLGKTQNQFAQILAVSPKAVQSFEQGWRHIPAYVERQALVLLSLKISSERNNPPCWEFKCCQDKWRENCIIWELKARNFCWAINGTFCQGQAHNSWDKKMQICRDCEVYRSTFSDLKPINSSE